MRIIAAVFLAAAFAGAREMATINYSGTGDRVYFDTGKRILAVQPSGKMNIAVRGTALEIYPQERKEMMVAVVVEDKSGAKSVVLRLVPVKKPKIKRPFLRPRGVTKVYLYRNAYMGGSKVVKEGFEELNLGAY